MKKTAIKKLNGLSLKSIKIKKLVILLVVVEILTMVGILSATYVQQFISANMVGEQIVENAMQQAYSKLEDSYKEIQNATKEISYNQFVSRFLTAGDAKERREYFTSVESLLSYTETMNPNIQLIVITDSRGNMYTSNGFTQVGRRMIENDAHALSNIEKEYINGSVYYDKIQNRQLFSYSIPIYSVLTGTAMERIGVCTVIMRADELADSLSSIDIGSDGVMVFKDASGAVIGTKPSDLNLEEWPGEGKYIEKTVEFSPYGWAVLSYAPEGRMSASMGRVLTLWILVCIAVVGITSLIGAVIIRSITGPVTKIAGFISGSQWQNQRLDIKYSNEIGQLAGNINHMLDTVNDANREILETSSRLYETELRRKQSELSALQSQINPHFLYNTLDCIRSIALVNGIDELSVIAEGMSHIFRYSIKGDDIVTVREELECVDAYMGIMTTRFPDKIEYEKSVSPEAADLKIPKMILQPIVENAVYHGIEAKRGKGRLSIQIYVQDNCLCFEVTDDGVGMEAAEVEELNRELNEITDAVGVNTDNLHIGLKNIIGRIRLNYGKKCGMKVYSEKFVRTTIALYMDAAGQLADDAVTTHRME